MHLIGIVKYVLGLFVLFVATSLVSCASRATVPQEADVPVGETGNAEAPLVSEPRQAVAYVETQLPEGLRSLFLQLGANPNISEEYRSIFLQHASGRGSGSGVALSGLSTQGTTIVVTNRHVVERTDVPRVSFDEGHTLASATILYVDPEYDLAVMEVPGRFGGLELRTEYQLMEEVFAMGFPGMNAQGSFQATRGNISNNCIPEGRILDNGSSRCWIQHTAAIDPGSSGGPLISANKVVGLNTALSAERHDVFFAVPAQAIQLAVAKANEVRSGKGDREWMHSSLQRTCHSFVSELASSNVDARRVLPLISTALVVENGVEAYELVMQSEKGFLVTQLFEHDPLAAMRTSVLLFIRRFIEASQGIRNGERCEEINPSDDVLAVNGNVRITTTMHDGDRLELFWRFENGRWRLTDFNRR